MRKNKFNVSSLNFKNSKEELIQLLQEQQEHQKKLETKNEELKASEIQFRLLFENSPIGIGIADLNGKLLIFNDAILKPGKYKREDFKILNVAELYYDPKKREEVLNLYQKQGYVKNFEVRFKRKDKTPYIASLSLLKTTFNGQACIQAIVEDITNRKYMEEILKEKEKLLRESQIVAKLASWSRDLSTGKFSLSDEFYLLLGLNKNEFEATLENLLKFISPEDAEKLINKNEENKKAGGIPFVMDLRYHNSKDENKYGQMRIDYEKDDNGNIIKVTGTFQDITERKNIELELSFHKDRFAQLFENSPLPLVLLDEQDKVILINEAFSNLFEYFLDEIKGKPLNDLIVPEELKSSATNYSNATHYGEQVNVEGYRRKKNGDLIYVQIIGIPIIINEKTAGIYGMYVDLSIRKDSEEKLILAKELAEQASKFKDSFIANMSHEIRTPLNGIIGMANLIKDSFQKQISDDDLVLFDGVESASKRLIRTVEMILNYSQLQTGKIELVKEEINITKICNELINEFNILAINKKLDLTFEDHLNNPILFADFHKTKDSIGNLIDNAIKYTIKGFIKLKLYKNNEDEILLDISDSGIGIGRDKINIIFDPYIQEDIGYSRKYEGVGLGLSIVKKYIEMNNFKISVVSKKNEGSTFTINFGKDNK